MARINAKKEAEKTIDEKLAATRATAQSWSDNVDVMDGAKELEEIAPSSLLSKRTTLRLHPDIIEAIERKARIDRRKTADVLRELLLKGMVSSGISI